MLTYNVKKDNIKRSDHVREILAKLDAKQSKTGLSLYSHQSTALNSAGDPLSNEEKTSFPNVNKARKNANKRITSDSRKYPSIKNPQQRKPKAIPHKLPENPGNTTNLPPVFPHGINKQEEERIAQPPNVIEQQFDKEKVDINVNPFGYTRKTLAFQTRNINYVVEWPETWPFRITSFQRKKKPLRKLNKDCTQSPPDIKSISTNENTSQDKDEKALPEPSKARVLAPVEHQVKPSVSATKPYVDSSLLKRAAKKPHPTKDYGNRFTLVSRQGNEIEFVSSKDESVTNPILPETSRENLDSCPPSTPVPGSQQAVTMETIEKELNQNEQEPIVKNENKTGEEDVTQDNSSLLTDIVNQIIAEDKPLTI